MNIRKFIIRALDLDSWLWETWLKRYRAELNDLLEFKTKIEHGESVLSDCMNTDNCTFKICPHGRLWARNIELTKGE